ncbi:MAG: universal stress protein [Chloroflexota bacterium]|nr:universal stress protein [Chloroflexota bacterium]
MEHIVCAARGGPGSRPAIELSISLAQENDARLTFLYIVDCDFLGHAILASSSIIHQQLREMGEFIMLKLQAEAASLGVEADFAIEEGTVREGIRHFVNESGADTVVVGRPAREKTADVFDSDSLVQFSALLEAEIGVRVILVGPDDIHLSATGPD